MRSTLCLVGFLSFSLAQEALIQSADSLRSYGAYAQSVSLYDSASRVADLSLSQKFRVQTGLAEAYLALDHVDQAEAALRSAQTLAHAAKDSVMWAYCFQLQAEVWMQAERYSEAESLIVFTCSFYERKNKQKTIDFAYAQLRLGKILYHLDDYDKAEVSFVRSKEIITQLYGPLHPELALPISNLAVLYWRKGAYDSAKQFFLEAKDILSVTIGVEHPSYLDILNNLAIVYRNLGLYKEAEDMHREVIALRARVLGTSHPDYFTSLNNLAILYGDQGKFAQAETLLLQVKEFRAQTLGLQHPAYLTVAQNLAVLYREQGRFAEAETLLLATKATYDALGKESSMAYTIVLNNLAVLYYQEGLYPEAERAFLQVLTTLAQLIGEDTPDYGITLNNLAVLYWSIGRYTEAERLFLRIRDLYARLLGTTHPNYISVLNKLAVVYVDMGRYPEAEAMYKESLRLASQVFGTENELYIDPLANLANFYYLQKEFSQSESLYTAAVVLQGRVLGQQHPEYAKILQRFAEVYLAQQRYTLAETLCLQAKDIIQQAFGIAHPQYAQTLRLLGDIYAKNSDYPRAESFYTEAKNYQKAALGIVHPDYLITLRRLSEVYVAQERYDLADPLWSESVRNLTDRIRRELPALPAAHKQKLLENVLSENFLAFQRYLTHRGQAYPELTALGYRTARNLKGLVLASVEGMRYLVERRAGQDSALARLHADWLRLREKYAFYALQERQSEADSILALVSEKERAILERLPELERYFPDLEREPLYPPLKRSEAVIEVVRVPYEKGDSVLYLYYVIVPEGRRHRLSLHVRRVDGAWERRALLAYEILRSPGAEVSGSAYRLLWGEVDSLLPRGVKAVYFSPDGVYYRVNVATLYDGVSFVGDRYEVRYVASSRRLLRGGVRVSGGRAAVVGAPNFYGSSGEVRAPGVRSVRYFAGGVPPLPGAEAEARRVAALLGVEAVVGDSATEGYVKSLRGPEVLHIATHGYFMGEGRDAMLSGGLLLAQAGIWDSLYAPFGVEDGRLTAREAANLNLLGTRLVVLSACETGLGEVKGEGLYGLQRGFLEAGAERVIAALWAVDDVATRELMEGFYRRWVRSKGKSVEGVFSRVLREFRKRYPEPYYWGAFVVMR